jgi:hypothetical protein
MEQGSSPRLPAANLATNKSHGGCESLLIGKVRGILFLSRYFSSMMNILVKGPTASMFLLVLVEAQFEGWMLGMLFSSILRSSLGYPAARLFSREQSESGVYVG